MIMKRQRNLHVVPSQGKPALDRSPHVAPGLVLLHRDTNPIRYNAKGEPIPDGDRARFLRTLAVAHDWDVPTDDLRWGGIVIAFGLVIVLGMLVASWWVP